jgi:hypothetical protein
MLIEVVVMVAVFLVCDIMKNLSAIGMLWPGTSSIHNIKDGAEQSSALSPKGNNSINPLLHFRPNSKS